MKFKTFARFARNGFQNRCFIATFVPPHNHTFMHKQVEPSILYFGTPVIILSTINEDGTINIAPISSVFWLGWRAVIGIGTASQTFLNLQRTGECVINLPSVHEVAMVNRLALITGRNPVPLSKRAKGYRYEKNKLTVSGFTASASDTVSAYGLKECPVQMETKVISENYLANDDSLLAGRLATFELKILKVLVEENLLVSGATNKIDPDKWRPLIMSFQKFYGLGAQVHVSALAEIPEELYAVKRPVTQVQEI